MSLAALVRILERSSIFMPCVEILDDPHEGSLTQERNRTLEQMYDGISQQMIDAGKPELAKEAKLGPAQFRRDLRRATYVSCWHVNDEESEAMWRLYCGASQGVAICTTYDKLAATIKDPNVHIGLVRYIDYERKDFPSNDIADHFTHKRAAFEHEREVRIVSIDLARFVARGDERRELLARDGIEHAVDVETLIDAIYVHPYARAWYEDAVKTVVGALSPKLKERVKWSKIRSEPFY